MPLINFLNICFWQGELPTTISSSIAKMAIDDINSGNIPCPPSSNWKNKLETYC